MPSAQGHRRLGAPPRRRRGVGRRWTGPPGDVLDRDD